MPRGWDRRFVRAWNQANQRLGPVGVAGVYGVRLGESQLYRAGKVLDRDPFLEEPEPLPGRVDTLDELLLAVPRGTPLRFEAGLGFHFYGADLCLQARQRGLAAVALQAVCFHNSRSVGLPAEFMASGEHFARKWIASLPVATSCVVIDRQGKLWLS